MQRLNIPLHRYQHTTRLSRRVVSLFLALTGAGFASLLAVGILWFGRDTTSRAAPQDTAVVLHFSPSRLSWNATERSLGDLTLVSNRPLSVTDIRSFSYGEFSLFISSDGTRSVAVRCPKQRLPTDKLDSIGVLATEVSNDVFLLSDRPVARMDWEPPIVWTGWLHLPTYKHIGNAFMLAENASGPILTNAHETRIRLPKLGLSRIPLKTLPNDTLLVLAMPVLPNTDITTVTNSIDTVLSSYRIPKSSSLAEHLATHPGIVLLTEKNDGIRFLISSSSKDFDTNLQQTVIQMAAALESPRIQTFDLPDNSKAQEMIVDPERSTVEETTVSGALVSRVAIPDGEYLYASESAGNFVMTNDQTLLEFLLKNGEMGTKTQSCDGNVGFVNIERLLAKSSEAVTSRFPDTLIPFSSTYPSLAVSNSLFSTSIRFCHR